MDIDLNALAVRAALENRWEEAAELNKQILRQSPKDIDALNRLARAQSELGKVSLARKLAKEVIKLDPLNQIAAKSLAKWKNYDSKRPTNSAISHCVSFIEEPGITKIVTLVNPGCAKILSKICAGEEARIITHAHRVVITAISGKYVGKLPDPLSARLRNLISQGYEYKVYIKSLEDNGIQIFLKEIKRGKKSQKFSSFPTDKHEPYVY